MAANDLNTPLQDRRARARRSRRLPLAEILSVAAVALALTAIVWIAIVDDPDGGRPVEYAAIQDNAPQTTGTLGGERAAAATAGRERMPSPAASTDVAALPTARAPKSVRATAAPIETLVESSEFGQLPVIGPDGLRPLDAYARPAGSGPGDGFPRVVIVVGGLGISQTGTKRAVESLSPDVTLAFAPHGGSLGRWVGEARRNGHEVLLQLPLEPFGYPNVDPGPRTLLVDNDELSNIENLEWVLGRATSYTGVMNHMGARYATDDSAMHWLISALAERGLMYLDDGTVARSATANVGAALGAPVVRADLVIDKVRSAAQIGKALDELEQIARSRGLAVGVASAFPTSVAAVSDWVDAAAARGIVVVPASAALVR